MATMKRTQFGNPILRKPARKLTAEELRSEKITSLIADMKDTLKRMKYGVGLAAPQVGHGIAITVISTKPTPNRPHLPEQELTLINPEIVKTYGNKTGQWEGCLSLPGPFAQTMRYRKIRVKYSDEKGVGREKDFDGFLAHVLQHEIDHLNGVLFVDRVKDSSTFMSQSEFRKRIAPTLK